MEIAIEKCICFLSSGLVRMVSRYAYGDLVVEAAIHIDFVVWLTTCGHFVVHSWSLLLGYHLWSLCCPLMVTVVQVTTCGHFVVHSWSLCCSGYHLRSLCCPLMVTLLFRLPLEVMKTKIRNNLQVLELAGMVSHKDHYQDLINAIVQVRPPHLSHLAFPMQLCCLCGCLFWLSLFCPSLSPWCCYHINRTMLPCHTGICFIWVFFCPSLSPLCCYHINRTRLLCHASVCFIFFLS